jgi:tetratricopeptide (TPR) repeat protein
MKALPLLLCISFSSVFPAFAQTEAIALYEKRADGAIGLKANQAIIFKALGIFQKEYENSKNKEIAGLYLMRCHTYIGRFVETDIEKKKAQFQYSRNIGETLIKLYPNSAAIRFEYVSAIGLWAELVGAMKCAKDGVLGKMKTQTETLIHLDSMFNNCSGFKILGLMNLKTPYIPFFLTWPSDKEAKKLVEKAVLHFPNDHGNNFYYAEILEKFGQKEKAKKYLNKVLELPCRKSLLLEDLAFQEDAKKQLIKLGK